MSFRELKNLRERSFKKVGTQNQLLAFKTARRYRFPCTCTTGVSKQRGSIGLIVLGLKHGTHALAPHDHFENLSRCEHNNNLLMRPTAAG